ncbi:MAG: M48 family metallopeptidase [Rhodoferax sp.]
MQLQHQMVAYALLRSARKSIGLRVCAQGLVVRVPQWVSQAQVDAALQGKALWVLRQLQRAQERARQEPLAPLCWEHGASLPYLGQPVRLALEPALDAGVAVWEPGTPQREPRLLLRLPPQAQPSQVRDAAQAWLMRQARQHFSARLDHFAQALGVRWTQLHLSSAHTRWGSARADGVIRLHWRLIHLREPLIDYVVAHELSHLRVMNHSPQFWDTVSTVVPQWGELRRELRETTLAPL